MATRTPHEYSSDVVRFIDLPLDGKQMRYFRRYLAKYDHPGREPTTVSKLLSERQASLEAVYKYFERVSRWIPANPSIANIVKRLDDTYLPLVSTKTNGNVPIANLLVRKSQPHSTENELSSYEFDRLVADERNSVILLCGARGVGKTAFLNHWLSKKSPQLEGQNLTWFRIDMAKVFRYWTSRRLKEDRIGEVVSRYHRAHLMYVVLVYGGALERRNCNIQFNKGAMSGLLSDVVASLRAMPAATLLLDKVSDKFIAIANDLSPKRDVSADIVDRLLDLGGDEFWSTISDLYTQINDALRKKSIRQLLVVDGLDNISWSRTGAFYLRSCVEIETLVREQIARYGVKAVLAVRPETAVEIRSIFESSTTGSRYHEGNGVTPTIAYVEAPDPLEVILRKVQAARASEAFDSDRVAYMRQAGGHKKLQEELERFGKSFEHSVRQLLEVVRQDYTRLGDFESTLPMKSKVALALADESPSAACSRLFFDNDVRGFFDNMTKVLRAVDFCAARSTISGDLHLRLPEYMLLNGRTFFDSSLQEKSGSRKDYGHHGGVFPNPFYYSTALEGVKPYEWCGLTGSRLLQFLSLLGECSAGDSIYSLEKMFGYPRSVITEVVESFIAFGLVQVRVISDAAERAIQVHRMKAVNEDASLVNYNVKIDITDKGRLYLEYIWLRPDLLYYFALDTPLGATFVGEASSYVKQARDLDSFDAIADFFEAAIPTVATLLRHVVHFDREERSSALRQLNTLTKQLSELIRPSELADIIQEFRMPRIWVPSLRNTVGHALLRDGQRPGDLDVVDKTRKALDALLVEVDAKDAALEIGS